MANSRKKHLQEQGKKVTHRTRKPSASKSLAIFVCGVMGLKGDRKERAYGFAHSLSDSLTLVSVDDMQHARKEFTVRERRKSRIQLTDQWM